MEEKSIPKKLVEKYNIFKMEHLKYSIFNIENFENEVNKENSMIDSLKSFLKSLENLYSKISEFISSNKNTFNDTCSENGIKSLDYLFIIKSLIYLLNTIISKLEKKDFPEETFQSIYNVLNQNFPKIFEVQYPKNDSSLLKNLETDTNEVIDYSSNIKKSTNNPGNILTSLVLYFNIQYIKVLNDSIQKFESIKQFKDTSFFNNQTTSNEIILFDLLNLLKKLKLINSLIYFGYLLDENDLFNKKEDSEEWQNLKHLLWGVKPKKDFDIEKRCTELFKTNINRMAQMSEMIKGDTSKFKMIGNMFGNMFNSKQGELNSKKIFMQLYGLNLPIPNKTFKINPLMKKMMAMRLPNIDFRTKLYLRKEFKPITLEYIKELNDFMNGKITEPKDKNIFLFNTEYKLPEDISKRKLYSTQLDKSEKDFYISTRLMNSTPLTFKENSQGQKNEFNNTLLIHINGGGFRSNNTKMMEKYQRQWAKDSGVALMTIKKPDKDDDFYPATLNQLYQVYMWILTHAKDELNMDIKKIIFSGDSARGILSLSLIIKDYKNMFVSPLYVSDKIIENFPRIRFFFGEKDPGRDEFLRGLYNFRKCKDIRAYDFIGLYHNFNGIDDPDVYEMVKDFIIEEVKDIISK